MGQKPNHKVKTNKRNKTKAIKYNVKIIILATAAPGVFVRDWNLNLQQKAGLQC